MLNDKIARLIKTYGEKTFQELVIAYYLNLVARTNKCILDGHDVALNPCQYCHKNCILAGKTIPRRAT